MKGGGGKSSKIQQAPSAAASQPSTNAAAGKPPSESKNNESKSNVNESNSNENTYILSSAEGQPASESYENESESKENISNLSSAAGKAPPKSNENTKNSNLSIAKPVLIPLKNLVEGKEYFYSPSKAKFPDYFSKITFRKLQKVDSPKKKDDPTNESIWFELQYEVDGSPFRMTFDNKSNPRFYNITEAEAYAKVVRAARSWRNPAPRTINRDELFHVPVPIPFENLVIGKQYIMNLLDYYSDNRYHVITILEKVPSVSGKVLKIRYEKFGTNYSYIKEIDFSKYPKATFYDATKKAMYRFRLLSVYNKYITNNHPNIIPYNDLKVGKEYIEKNSYHPASKIRLIRIWRKPETLRMEVHNNSKGKVSFTFNKSKKNPKFYNYSNDFIKKRVNYAMSRSTIPDNVIRKIKGYLGGKRLTRKLKKRKHRTRKN